MIFLGIISHFSCFCFLLLSLRVQEQKISLQVKRLIHNSAWHCILLKRSYTCLDAWSENRVVMIMKFSHGIFLAAFNKFGFICCFSFSFFFPPQKDFGCLLLFMCLDLQLLYGYVLVLAKYFNFMYLAAWILSNFFGQWKWRAWGYKWNINLRKFLISL